MDVIAEGMCLWMHKVLCAAAAGSGLEMRLMPRFDVGEISV